MIGLGASKLVAILGGAAGLLAAIAVFSWLSLKTVAAMVEDARRAAIAETDARWQAEIAGANLKVALAEAGRANEAMRLNGELAKARETVRIAQDELEKANEILPDGDRNGLDAARVQLLNRR